MVGYGNNFESEVLFPRETSFIVNDITYDNNGIPTIYLTEVANEQKTVSTGRTEETFSVNNRGQQKVSSKSDSSSMQRLSEQNTGFTKLQTLSKGNIQGNTKQPGELQRIQAKVEDFDAKTSRELEIEYDDMRKWAITATNSDTLRGKVPLEVLIKILFIMSRFLIRLFLKMRTVILNEWDMTRLLHTLRAVLKSRV